MRTPRAAVFALLALLVVPGFTSTATLGISAGDSATFVYDIHAITLQVSGHRIYNSTTTQKNILSIDVLSVNTTKSLGVIAYRETITLFNSTTLATPRVGQNLTAIFNPYDNNTYIGKLGFYPFTYTNLKAGSAKNLTVQVSLLNYPGFNGTVYAKATLNATVTRDPRYIYVSCIIVYPRERPFYMAMKYNATTGVLFNMTTRASFLGTPQILTYQLLQFGHISPESSVFSVLYSPYFVAAVAVVLVAVLGGYEVTHRKAGKAKRAERLRGKLGRK
ncbi:MAG TPA: hypothetical protein VKF15_01520 [Nitrososphaerales archaeon]|nr:hypothetical protein [Nitrososphaerales archaeon]